MKFKSILILSLFSLPAIAEMKSMDLDDMDAILSETGAFTSQPYQHSFSMEANFELGTSNGKLSSCSNKNPRRNTSFYPCWNGQSKSFLSKLAFTINPKNVKENHSHFTFQLNNKGKLENIKINGVKDQLTRRQLTNLLKEMEFGYAQYSHPKMVSLSITTKETNQ